MPRRSRGATRGREGWTFLTNHAAVLLAIYDDSNLRLRDIAERVGITERATHQIVTDLVAEGYLTVEKVGRRNVYEVSSDFSLRRQSWDGADLLALLKSLTRRAR